MAATLSSTGGNPNGTGSYTATCSGAQDVAGNSGSASVRYSVAFRWAGFLQPVDNLPTINTATAGSSIPVKFSLGGDYGVSILPSGYPKVQAVACPSGGGTGGSDAIEETAAAGGSGSWRARCA